MLHFQVFPRHGSYEDVAACTQYLLHLEEEPQPHNPRLRWQWETPQQAQPISLSTWNVKLGLRLLGMGALWWPLVLYVTTEDEAGWMSPVMDMGLIKLYGCVMDRENLACYSPSLNIRSQTGQSLQTQRKKGNNVSSVPLIIWADH